MKVAKINNEQFVKVKDRGTPGSVTHVCQLANVAGLTRRSALKILLIPAVLWEQIQQEEDSKD